MSEIHPFYLADSSSTPGTRSFDLMMIGPTEQVDLGVRWKSGLTFKLAIRRVAEERRAFRATLNTNRLPLAESSPLHFNLSPWEIPGDSVDFGDGQPVRALLLCPTLSHNKLYGTPEARPSEDLERVFGFIAVGSDALQKMPLINMKMPAVAYNGMSVAFAEKREISA